MEVVCAGHLWRSPGGPGVLLKSQGFHHLSDGNNATRPACHGHTGHPAAYHVMIGYLGVGKKSDDVGGHYTHLQAVFSPSLTRTQRSSGRRNITVAPCR